MLHAFLFSLLLAAAPAYAKTSSPCEDLLLELHTHQLNIGYTADEARHHLRLGFHTLPAGLELLPQTLDPGLLTWWTQQTENQLGYPHLNYDRIALNYLTALNIREDKIDPDTAASLLRHLPLWGPTENGLEIATAFYQRSFNPLDVLLISAFLPVEDREEFRARVTKIIAEKWSREALAKHGVVPLGLEAQYLRLVSITPLDWIPATVREILDETWLSLKDYPAQKLKSVLPSAAGTHSAGDCVEMTRGHIATLELGTCTRFTQSIRKHLSGYVAGATVLVRVRGQLVGAIKMEGDMSMIALRNIVDGDGRLVLAMGGVYEVFAPLVNRVADGELSKSDDLNVTELRVKSKTFMFNSNAWNHETMPLLPLIAAPDISKDDLLEFSAAVAAGTEVPRQSRAYLHSPVWRGFLKALQKRYEQLR